MNPAKKNNAITNALASVYGQMFPGGKQEERILTTELYEQLGGRVQKKIVNGDSEQTLSNPTKSCGPRCYRTICCSA